MIKSSSIKVIIVMLIILPIIVFGVYFCKSFWGAKYKLNVNSSNITDIEETLYKDNIKIDDFNNVIRIELCGAGLNDYSTLKVYYNNYKNKSIDLYFDKQPYYIEKYLAKHTFYYDDVFNISVFISVVTIIITIWKSRKKKIKS